MAIKTTEIRDKVQILKGTVQKQMIHHVLFQTKKMLFVVVVLPTTSPKTVFSINANGRQRVLASHGLGLSVCPAPCPFCLC